MAKQIQAKNAVHRIRRKANGKRRALECFDTLEQPAGVMGARVIEHRLGVVRGQYHAVDVFGQHRPEAPGTARQVEDKPWLPRHLQGLAYQPRIAPRRQALQQPGRTRVATAPGMLTVIALGEFGLDGGWRLWRHRGLM